MQEFEKRVGPLLGVEGPALSSLFIELMSNG